MPRQLKLRLSTLRATENSYILEAAKHRGLVLGGGGAKGIGYSGMIRAMHESGFIQGLTHISGASAGAMTASLLAVGMGHENIEKLLTQLEVPKLLDSDGFFRLRAVGEHFRNILEIMYLQQIKEHMAGIKAPTSPQEIKNYQILVQKIRMYEFILNSQGIVINSVEDIIKLGEKPSLLRLDAAFATLPTNIIGQDGSRLETPRVTFADLARLRSVLPIDKQHLIKNFSVVITNQTTGTLETYSEEQGADESIAEKAQQSGAHPFLFSPRSNERGDSMADGSIMDNMPIKALELAGLDKEEILCVKLESEDLFDALVQQAENHAPEVVSGFYSGVDRILEFFLGAQVYKGQADVINREKIFHHIGNMLYINSGTLTTTTKAPTPDQKKHVIKEAHSRTHQLFANHRKTFNHPLIPMLHLDVSILDKILANQELINYEVKDYAEQAKQIFVLQNKLVEELNNGDINYIDDYVQQIKTILKCPELDPLQQEEAIAICLHQIDYFSKGKFNNYIFAKEDQSDELQQVSWFTRLLELLYMPIQWIVSLFSNPAASNSINSVEADDLPREVHVEILVEKPMKETTSSRGMRMFSSISEPKASPSTEGNDLDDRATSLRAGSI